MSAIAPQNSLISRISSLLGELNGENIKVANGNVKVGSEMATTGDAKDGGSGTGRGKSTHPSAKADGNLFASPMGSRAKENEADVKEDHPGAGVDNTSPTSGGTQDDNQFHVGLTSSATGEGPQMNFKGTKDDPGTTAEADAENIGEKYASTPLTELTKLAFDRMNEVLADIANNVHQPKTAAAEVVTAANAGYELAGLVSRIPTTDQEKLAASRDIVERTIQDALEDADLVGQYLTKYASNRNTLLKRAAGDPTGGMADGAGEPPPEAGGPPPMMPPDAGGGPPPGMGGPPPMPPDAGGGMPPGAGGPPPGAGGPPGGGHEQALNELVNALMEMGISPDELMQTLSQGGGAGGGGPPPDAGGGPPPGAGGPPPDAGGGEPPPEKEAAAQRQTLYKIAGDAKMWQRSGRAKIKEAQEGSVARQERDAMKAYIVEVVGHR